MAKKIKIATVLSILAIIACAACALMVVNGRQIDAVEKPCMSESSVSTATINWSAVKNADGYKIYIKSGDSEQYNLYTEIDDGTTVSYSLDRLTSATVYEIKITAFRYFLGEVYESKEARSLTVYTLPDAVSQNLQSPEEGVLTVSWDKQENVTGYQLEYSLDDSFETHDAKEVDADTNEIKIDGLTPEDVYYTRMRSFFTVNSENIYGQWSDTAHIKIRKKIVAGSNIDPNKPIVALSFDDGPGYGNDGKKSTTEQILDVLEEYGARATFFMCGSRINNSNVDCLKREIKLGCELGNHTYDHTDYGRKVTAKDIQKCNDTIKEKCGQEPTIFRCPGGIMTSTIQNECKQQGMPIAYWSVDTEDWKSKNPDAIYDKVMNNVYDGSIILMHDIYPTTVEAVKKVVPKLIEDGYQIVTVTEMLTVKNGGKAPEAGQQYIDYKTINNNT